MPNIPPLVDLLKAGAHFGHRPSKRHPKMEPYLYGIRNGISIIDLEQTQAALTRALAFLVQTVAAGGTVLLVGTKRQAREAVLRAAEQTTSPYVVNRWLGGTFTNFTSISRLAKKLKKIREDEASGQLAKYVKKEQLVLLEEAKRLEEMVGGIQSMERLPQAIFLTDVKVDKTALREANKMKIPVVALNDSNTNPGKVNYPIPCNDDAAKTIELMVGLIGQAIREGQQQAKERPAAEPAKPMPVAEALPQAAPVPEQPMAAYTSPDA